MYNVWQDASVWLFGAFGWQWLSDAATINPWWPTAIAVVSTLAVIQTVKNQSLTKQLAPHLLITYDPENCRKNVRYQTGLDKISERVSHGGGPKVTNGVSIRVCVANKNPEPALNCEGFLTRVEFREDDETEFRRQPLYEPHKVPWALEEFAKVTIKKGVQKYLGIVSASEIDNHFGFRSDVTSNSTKARFSEAGEYRFHGSIAADTGGTVFFVVGIIWNGQWDEIKAWLVENT